MKINFEITSFPQIEQVKYLPAYLEGTVTIVVDDILFFRQSAIPLIEFAGSINDWLAETKSGDETSFLYESMDFDKPILVIEYVERDRYKLDSIWKERDILRLLSKDEITRAFNEYLNDLSQMLEISLKWNLKTLLTLNVELSLEKD